MHHSWQPGTAGIMCTSIWYIRQGTGQSVPGISQEVQKTDIP